MKYLLPLLLAFTPVSLLADTTKPEVELAHFWISRGERAALQELEKAIEQRGGNFTNIEIENYDKLRALIVERLSLGYPPAITQWLGGDDMKLLHEMHAIKPLPSTWQEQPLATLLFPEVLEAISLNDQITGIPIGVHIQNVAFYSAKIYNSLKLPLPKNWSEFLEQAKIIKQAGYTPLALATEPWHLRFIFNPLLIEKLGHLGFKEFYSEEKPIAKWREGLLQAFDIFLKLKPYVDPKYAHYKWNESALLVVHNQAAMNIMGDFVKGEFIAEGKVADKDFFCAIAPGSGKIMIYGIDSFITLDNKAANLQAGQKLLFDIALNPEFQLNFNIKKGGIPILKNMDSSRLDACANQHYQAWKTSKENIFHLPDASSRLRLTFLQNTLQKAWLNNLTAEQATNELIQLVDEALAAQNSANH
ncbi:glucose/mannose transport system substrate-binding protein [Thiothrix eikelboomii]|uniref:Glucose/mannose transport system substrate-binding protein n=1 Tax=Thiothrix eikelboomii TaxID=92487 RepID=A0A1T4W733_9GAMM|nr:ABC transporter substrate-binding protein [Thiothrix eikelboomii]SKA72521.1 glucose/mannose transport system substrate-binding protein [Thiothrix eikelboomii]